MYEHQKKFENENDGGIGMNIPNRGSIRRVLSYLSKGFHSRGLFMKLFRSSRLICLKQPTCVIINKGTHQIIRVLNAKEQTQIQVTTF